MATIAPAVRKAARDLGVDIEKVKGTGKNGAVKLDDVRAAAGQPPVQVNSRARDEGEARHTQHHMKDGGGTVEVGGMRFKRPERGTLDHSTSKTLDIPEKYKNNELHYHWVTDTGGRVEQFRERYGYAAVPDIETPEGDKITTRRRTGTNKDGSPQYQQLMATPKEFRDERKKAAELARKQKESGRFENAQDDGDKPMGDDFYMKGDTKIQRA